MGLGHFPTFTSDAVCRSSSADIVALLSCPCPVEVETILLPMIWNPLASAPSCRQHRLPGPSPHHGFPLPPSNLHQWRAVTLTYIARQRVSTSILPSSPVFETTAAFLLPSPTTLKLSSNTGVLHRLHQVSTFSPPSLACGERVPVGNGPLATYCTPCKRTSCNVPPAALFYRAPTNSPASRLDNLLPRSRWSHLCRTARFCLHTSLTTA